MKQLLSLLLCVVFLNTQTFAKHQLPGGGLTSITGIYGGVLIPRSTTTSDGVTKSPSNSIGLFSFVLPTNGFGAGSVLMFANGTVYDGEITAMGDPTKFKINAIIAATYDYTVSYADGTQIDLTAQSNGQMEAKVESYFGYARLSGKATIEISQGQVDSDLNPIITEQTEYTVSGVRQSVDTTSVAAARIAIP